MKKKLLLITVMLYCFPSLAQVTVSLGTYTGNGTTNVLLSTSTTTNRYSRTISLYTASEIIAEGGMAGVISSLAWDKHGTGEYTTDDAYIKIYLKHVTNSQWTSVPDWNTEVATADEVFTSSTYSIPTGTGWKEVPFTTPFIWNGTDNIAVFVEWDRSSAPTGNIGWGRSTTTDANATRVGSAGLNALILLINSNRPLLQLTIMPSACWKPSGLTLDNLTATSAEFSWTASADETDGYNWAVMASGSHPDSDTPIVSGSTASGIVTAAVTQLNPNTAYSIFVQADCGSDLSFWEGPLNILTPIIPPSNDECDDAIMLTMGIDFDDEAVISNNLGATNDPNDPFPSCDSFNFASNGKDVWYTVTIPASGNVFVETRSSNDPGMNNTGMEIYSGICGNLALIECNADDGEGFFSLIELTGQTPGEILLVRVWGYNNHAGEFLISAYNYTIVCNAPTNVTLEEAGIDFAEFSWTASAAETNGYEWEVFNAGDDPMVDPSVASGTVATGVTTVIVTGLDENTAYDFYVRTDCDPNGMSDWEGPLSFTTDDGAGVGDFGISTVVFYPNPMGDVVNVTAQVEIEKVTIYSLTGQKIIEQRVGGTNAQIDVSYFASAPYFMQVTTANGSVGMYNLIKK